MGCSESKDALPVLLCFFEVGNKQQQNYCIKLKDNFRHEKSIRFEIKSLTGVGFSVQFKIKNKIHTIQNNFNEDELDNTLNKMYQILDQNK